MGNCVGVESSAVRPTTQKDFAALQTALQNNNIQEVEKILQNFDLTATNKDGMNCVMLCGDWSWSPEVVNVMLKKIDETGGPVLLKSLLTATSNDGKNCLMLCCRFSSSPEVVKLILKKIEETGGPDLLKSQLTATDNDGHNCLMLCYASSNSPELVKIIAAVLFHFDLFKIQYWKLDWLGKKRLEEKTGIDSSSWTPDAASLAEVKAILQGADPHAAKKKAEVEAALAKKKAEEEAAAKKKAEEEAALAKKKAEEEAAAKKKAEEEAAAKKKAEKEAAAKKKAEEEADLANKKKADSKPSPSLPSAPLGIPYIQESTLNIDRKSPIGSGATCSVYSCTYCNTECAAKIFHSHITSDKTLQREMSAAVHLKHPNIVNVVAIIVDASDKSKIIGILMERMNGTLLQRTTNTAPFEDVPPPTVVQLAEWCFQTATAILCAHSLKCIHCDIKPENVMLDLQGNAKLTDFGSAHVISTAATKVTSVRGTALYIAPEYAAGDIEGPNEKTDVFSFGMLMWVVFHPKEDHGMGKNEVQIVRSLDRGMRPEIKKNVPTQIVSLIEKCWSADPKVRPEMADVLTVFNEVITKLKKPHNTTSFCLPPSPLWTDARYLKTRYGSLLYNFASLKWTTPTDAPSLHFSEDITDKSSPFFKLFEQKFRPSPAMKKTLLSERFSRLKMVQPADAHHLFLALHEADGSSRSANAVLRRKNNSDSATQKALEKLRSEFEDPDCNPLTNKQNFSRLLFGWHGTNAAFADAVCRDGPRSLRLTDAGFFGTGSYFSLEADYAAQYARSSKNTKGEYAIILFAISLSQTYPITLEHDYRSKEDANRPDMHGFSNFYHPDPTKALDDHQDKTIALAALCDSHFAPVKKYGDGYQHPLGTYNTMNGNAVVGNPKSRVACYLDQQACDAKDPEVFGHEIVIGNHQRAVPVAILYFK